MEKLIEKVRQQSTSIILESIVAIGGGTVNTETCMARAALIEVYGEREGLDSADFVMDSIGL